MRHLISVAAIAALLMLAGLVAPPARADVSFDFFYSNLGPHGSWLVSAEYGRVWQPREYRPGWNPYYDGHWVYSDVGWAWVSDYTWGAVPYHYGTWVLDPAVGWVWVPGYTWAPAWVVFRTGPEAIGWAPVSPEFAVGMTFGASAPVSASFVFVSNHDFIAPRIAPCVIPGARRTTVIQNTTIVQNLVVENNVVVNRGPDVRVVERASGQRLRPARIETVARVAPFTSVRRDELVIASERRGPQVKAVEPVSAKHPLPPSNERASVMRSTEPSRGPAPGHGPRRVEPPAPEQPAPAPHGAAPVPRSAPPPVQAPETRGNAQKADAKAGKPEAKPAESQSNAPKADAKSGKPTEQPKKKVAVPKEKPPKKDDGEKHSEPQ